MISVPELLTDAVSRGLVSAEEAAAGTATAEPAIRSNIVHRLVRGNQSVAFVKQGGAHSRRGGRNSVSHETAVLGHLGNSPLLGDRRPSVLDLTDDRALWTGVVPGTLLHQVPCTDAIPVAEAFGRSLAELHTTPVPDDAPVAPTPWVLDGADGRFTASCRSHRPNEGAVRDLARDPIIASTLAGLRRIWDGAARKAEHALGAVGGVQQRWTHGDLSTANVLAEWTETDGWVVRFVDFELGGVGHPAWDLATAMDSLTVLASRSADSTGRRRSGKGQDTACALLTAFADGYRYVLGQRTGTSVPSRDFIHPDPAWRCARLLTRAWQTAAVADRVADDRPGDTPTWPPTDMATTWPTADLDLTWPSEDEAPTWPSADGACSTASHPSRCDTSTPTSPADPRVRHLLDATRDAAVRASSSWRGRLLVA